MKKVLLGLLLTIVVIQFIRPAKNQNDGPFANAIEKKYAPSEAVLTSLKKACYDCHSNNTIYPWYSQFQPTGWWLQRHVNEGKQHLNFDEFLTYSPKKQHHKLEEVNEAVKEGWMPLESYTWMHDEAKLTQAEKLAIAEWCTSTMNTIAKENNIIPEAK